VIYNWRSLWNCEFWGSWVEGIWESSQHSFSSWIWWYWFFI